MYYGIIELFIHFFIINCRADFALIVVTTFLPVLASGSFNATLATCPPCYVTFLFPSKVSGRTVCEIFLVDASASIFKVENINLIDDRVL
jgi:hypothetical protein